MTHTATLREAGRRADAGDWESAKAWYEAALAESVSAEALEALLAHAGGSARFGPRWTTASAHLPGTRRRSGSPRARCSGSTLCIWYLTNFDNVAAARGWLSRAKHLADQSGSPVVIGWTDLVAGYLADDPLRGREAIERAAATAEAASDPDLATMALADLGLWHELGRSRPGHDDAG